MVCCWMIYSLIEDPNAFCRVDTMDQWDEEKLRSVVLSKHGNPRTTTDVRFQFAFHTSTHLTLTTDRVQILHRSHRKPKIRVVLGMPKWK